MVTKNTKKELEEKEIFKIIRDKYFNVNSKNVLKIIRNSYENKNGKISEENILNNASNIIEEFNDNRKENWNLVKTSIEKNLFIFLLKDKKNIKKFPIIFKKLNKILKFNKKHLNKIKMENLLQFIHENTFELSNNFWFSNKQFERRLAGQMLESYLRVMLDILKIRYEYQVAFFEEGQINDIIIPSKKFAKMKPEDSYVIECQMTLKDRFRLTTGKAQTNININKISVSLGGKGIVRKGDVTDFSNNKIEEAKHSGWRMVLLKDVKNKKEIATHDNVLSFEDFFIELLEKNKIYKTK